MTQSFLSRHARTLSVALSLTAALSLGACARTAQLDVLRPAMINAAPFGNSFEVREFQGDPQASAQLQSALRERIASSLNHAITLVMANGGLAIQGSILRNEFHQEEQQRSETCTHTERVNNQDRTVNHPCTRIVTTGIFDVSVGYSVVVPATNQVLFSREYSSQRRSELSRRFGPYPGDASTSGQINPAQLKHDAFEHTVEQFSRVILPWRDTVEVTFEGCAGDARCSQAYEAVQAQRLDAAEEILNAVTGPDGTPIAEADRNRVSEAIYNRAMVRMLRGVYGAAFIDLQRAIELRPDKEEWRGRFQELEQLARDQDALREQQGGGPPSVPEQQTPAASPVDAGALNASADAQAPSAWGARP